MKSKSTPDEIDLDKLVLDKNNPRFAELYSGSDDEEEIIDYLLYTESAQDVAHAISEAQEFYPDRPLWVLKNGVNYIVRDGNRRCAAVKALQHPNKYALDLKKITFKKLPVLIYHNETDLSARIRQEHTSNLFKQWGRIAKALEIHRLYKSGNSIESMKEYDSSPNELIKLASFYYEAVKIGGEDLKKLLRSGRGKTGGKTIIFERLFRSRKLCGYTFKSRSTNEIDIKDENLFEDYITAMVLYLQNNPDTTSRTIDDYSQQEKFLVELKPFGFDPQKKESKSSNDENSEGKNNNGKNDENNSKDTNKKKRKSIKHKPIYERKKIPSPLESLINECYNLDQNNFANAKTALTRVTFECVLKYVLENTNQENGNSLSKNNHFKLAYYNKRGHKLRYTDFSNLKIKFTELIKDTGVRKAFEAFDLENPHQIIHNYRVAAVPYDAKKLCDNLIDLIEFMLQEESNLLSSLDLSKL